MKLIISSELFYPSRLGGPANTLFWIAKALARADVRVIVVTTDGYIEKGKVKPDTWTDVDGIRAIYCKSGVTCILKELYYMWNAMGESDAVMLCDMFQRQILLTAFMALARKKKIIWSPRGELFGPALEGNKLKNLYIGIVRKIFGRYATFHATSDEEREMIFDHIGKEAKVIVIPNYIELPKQMERKEPAIPYFLYVGRINAIKALDRLILGLAMSREFKKSKYIMLMVGPDQHNYQKELEKLIEQNELQGRVKFLGSVFGEKKYQLYANAHFSFLLSHSENFGNVVIEALSQGTPVVASKGTPWYGLPNHHAGFWINNSPEEIGETLDNIIKLSNEEYYRLREDARDYAHDFDIFRHVNEWINII